jgi:hypothetical protein
VSRTYSGAANGKGAVSEWNSNGSAGKGRMEITESVFPSKISIKVDFVRPFEAHNTNEFTLEPTGALTKVVWTITDFCNLAPFGSNGMKVAIRSDHCG